MATEQELANKIRHYEQKEKELADRERIFEQKMIQWQADFDKEKQDKWKEITEREAELDSKQKTLVRGNSRSCRRRGKRKCKRKKNNRKQKLKP